MKQNLTETMPILVVGNANPLWEEMPCPPKTRNLTQLGQGKNLRKKMTQNRNKKKGE